MRWLHIATARLRALFHRETVITEIEEEMRAHLDMDVQNLINRGLKPEEARSTALRDFGNMSRFREIAYEVRGGGLLETFWQDLRFGSRLLIRNPGFSMIAIITLSLGIGANTAIFSVVNAVLLRPLDYHDPQKIVTLLNDGSGPVSPGNFLDFRAGCGSFSLVAAAEAWGGTLGGNDRPEEVGGLRMGEGLFELLGVPPLVGRTLRSDDFQAGKDHVLVLSYKLWQRALAGDPDVVGRTLTVTGENYTVVGVMPKQFQFPPFWSTRAEMWAPLDLSARAASRGGNSLRVFGRLKPGTTIGQAQSEVDGVNATLAREYPESNAGLNLRVDPLTEKVVGKVRPALLMLGAAVGFVLLIACANVACLLLARTTVRQKETAVRVALGASRSRILRQLLTESLLLSFFGAVFGSLLAVWGVDVLRGLLAGNSSSFNVRLPRLNDIRIDQTALLFTLAVSLLTSMLFGLAPALSASKPDLSQVLKESARSTTGRRRLRESLVVAELALALVMLVGAGLLMNSFLKLQRIDPGFHPDNVLTMTISLAGSPRYAGESREAFYRELTERLRNIPGVEAVSAINHLPLAGDAWGRALTIDGMPVPPPGQRVGTLWRVCRPGYFKTMGIPLIEGREFDEQDDVNHPGVVIVNETLVKQHLAEEDPIGKRITLDDPGSKNPNWLTVVGVVKDVKQESWNSKVSNEVYTPFQQSEDFYSAAARHFTSMTVVARTSVNPTTLATSVRDNVRLLDRHLPVSNVISMRQVIEDSLWQPRFNLQLIGLFASVALLLAAVGLYGVVSYSVTQRSHEVGLRMALGAQRGNVVRVILAQGMRLVAAGVAIGIALSFVLTRLMASLLFEVSATDFSTLSLIAALLVVVALFACWLPAHRAARMDPLAALRYE
jgi:predicted permease